MDSVEELAILILAEGSLRYHNGYETQFVNTDEALNDYFTKTVERLGYSVKQKSPKQKVVYSRELAEKLLSLSPSYKTRATNGAYPQATFPEGAFADAGKALQLFFSCEGGVVLSGKKSCEVILRVCHPTLKRQARQMLYSLGINHTERGNGLISIKRKSDLRLFASKINFIEGARAVRGKHIGIEKRVLLGRLIRDQFPCTPPVKPSKRGFSEATASRPSS